MTLPILAITSGEPAGIGPDICLDLAQAGLPCRCVVLGDKDLLRRRAALLGKQITLRDFNPHRPSENPIRQGELEVWHIPLPDVCEAGRLNPANAPYVLQLLDTACRGVSDGLFAAIVTAPLHKGVINDGRASSRFSAGTPNIWPKKAGWNKWS